MERSGHAARSPSIRAQRGPDQDAQHAMQEPGPRWKTRQRETSRIAGGPISGCLSALLDEFADSAQSDENRARYNLRGCARMLYVEAGGIAANQIRATTSP